jgi:hypothetical protein
MIHANARGTATNPKVAKMVWVAWYHPIKATTASFDEALNDPMLYEMQFGFDFDPEVPWEEAS